MGPDGFNRRVTDATVSALSTRIASLEGRVEVVELGQKNMNFELCANTKLTKQTHEAVVGADGDGGLKVKVEEIYDLFATAKGGFKALESMGKIARSVAFIIAAGAAVWGLVTTHKWIWPGPS